MKERKYKRDYVNEERTDPRTGREKLVAVYRGDWYTAPGTRQERGCWAALPCLAYWLLIIGYYLINFPGATRILVFLPTGLSLFPAAYWGMGAFTVCRAPRRMTRLQKENGQGRVLRASTGCLICAVTAVLSDTALLLTRTVATRELPGLAMLCAAALCAGLTCRTFRAWERETKVEKGTEP